MNNRTLVAVFGYEGDSQQVRELMPMYEHHECPIVIVSPDDSKIVMGDKYGHVFAGKRAYVGQLSWDRQYLQLKKLLQDFPDFDWYLLNDSDSFVLTPELPAYLYEDPMVIYSNEVNDFRIPGHTWPGVEQPWPMDYHAGFPLVAMQPPYFASRMALERIVARAEGLIADPITPFIDWWWLPACRAGRVIHEPFHTGASCETTTDNGLAVMSQRIGEYGATFIHSVKSGQVMQKLVQLHQHRNAK